MKIFWAVFFCLIIYGLQQNIYKKNWYKNLDIDIHFKDKWVEAGEKASLIEVVNNDKWLPLSVFHVKFSTSKTFSFPNEVNANVTDLYHRNDVFSIMGHQKVTRTLGFDTSRRGLFFITGVNIVARDFFLTKIYARTLTNDSFIYVFPKKLYDVELDTLFNYIMGEIENKRSLWEDEFSFKGIRDYYPHDNIKSINWKATAKNDRLMVNTYNPTSEQRVKILLNMEPNVMMRVEVMEEISIEIAAAAADMCLSAHIPVMIMSNGKDILTGTPEIVDFGASYQHMENINKYLSRIDGNGGLPLFFNILDNELAACEKNVTYIIISPYHKEDLMNRIDDMVAQGMAVHMISPYFDLQEFDNSRSYVYGWKFKYNEV
jgi:hypothetical protein